MVATNDEDWRIMSWDKNIEILNQVFFNVGQYLRQQGILIENVQQFPLWEILELGFLRLEGLKGYFRLKCTLFNRKYPFNPSNLKHPNSKIFESGIAGKCLNDNENN
jgi:hypothetical protein